jgi:hypothetical protein
MQFLSSSESAKWCKAVGVSLNVSGYPTFDTQSNNLTIRLSEFGPGRFLYLSRVIASASEPHDECLLWVTLAGVWSSHEDMHLYYRLRETYAERRLLADAPGHRFLNYETTDLITFLYIGFLFGWDCYLFTNRQGVTAYISHDGFLHIRCSSDSETEDMAMMLDEAKVVYQRR